MSYLREFKKQIKSRDFTKFLELWEEYCTNDEADIPELISLLKLVKASDFQRPFGAHVELALPLWQTIEDQQANFQVLKHLIDLQTTNSPVLAEAAVQVIQAYYPDDPQQTERLRRIGLRTKEDFRGALSHYELLAHLAPGKFVYHSGGWGVGEIMEFSTVREQVGVEFENMAGLQYFNFNNAFKVLEPLADDHFLAQRFGDPDTIESAAKKDPVAVIKLLLKDLGPKSASEIKDEMCVLIIPEDEWNRWWQSARAKLKKDPFIQNPSSLKEPFVLRQTEQTNEELIKESFKGSEEPDAVILSSYSLMRDTPKLQKNQEIFDTCKTTLTELFNQNVLTTPQRLQIILLLEQFFGSAPEGASAEAIIRENTNIAELLGHIEILALKKRVLILIEEHREDWRSLFLDLLLNIQVTPLRDYIFDQLLAHGDRKELDTFFETVALNTKKSPELVVWYMQKLLAAKCRQDIPFGTKEGLWKWFDAFLVLLSEIEHNPKQRDLVKKMVHIVTQKHFLHLRSIFEGATEEWLNEFLLLLSKCMIFEESDRKIFNSLAQVVHANVGVVEGKKVAPTQDTSIFWATEKAYQQARDRAQQIATVEIVENAKEVEAARALGDLRENAEYKAATEKRRRLQHDLKTLGSEIDHARVITSSDIDTDAVGVGIVVTLKKGNGETITYTILGPWDADVDANILSHQSRIVQEMMGLKKGDSFTFREEEYTVADLRSYLN